MAAQLGLLGDEDLRSPDRGELVETPAWFVEALCPVLWPWGRRILDPGAGLGAIGRALHLWCARTKRTASSAPEVTAVELYADRCEELQASGHYAEVVCSGILEWCATSPGRWPLVLLNPAFRQWPAWVEALHGVLEPGGRIFALVPWEHISRRESFWRHRPAHAVHRTSRRPWKRETRECCWVEWRAGGSLETRLHWLDVRK